MSGRGLLWYWLALVAANYGYQAFTKADWNAAGERSFFQLTALLGYWALSKCAERFP